MNLMSLKIKDLKVNKHTNIVNESLFEFKKGMDPVESLGIGRRKMIKEWLDSMKVKHYIINDDYTIDVINNTVFLDNSHLTELPEFIQFNKIECSFWIQFNNLTSLRGCPKYVGMSFSCSNNNLSSLRGCPKIVNGSFWCNNNNLTSLKGSPKQILGRFYCFTNKVKFSEEDVQKVCDVKGDICV